MIMKSIRPITMITTGPVLLGIAISAGTWLVLPSSRHPSEMGWACLAGAAAGFAILGPVATVLAARARHPAWLLRHACRIGWYTSMAIGLSLGYLAACTRHGLFDRWALAAFGIVGLGAAIKIGLSDGPGANNVG
jgi:hypothetical protein